MSPRTGRHGRVRQLIEILLRDPTALTEVVSGFFLVAVRGLLLVGMPRLIGEGTKLSELLVTIGMTDQTWGTYLMICGALQIVLAGERRSIARVVVTFLIMVGFAAMAAGFYVAYSAQHVPPSIICMTIFYIFLLGRVAEDCWEARKAPNGARL